MLFGASLGDPWGQDEPRVSRFVFIGRNLNREELTKGFMDCLVTEPLRFDVGEKVVWKVSKKIREGGDQSFEDTADMLQSLAR